MNRCVVPDEVEVALRGVELQRESTRVTPGVGVPSSPATLENRASASVVVPGWNTAALVKAETSPMTSSEPNAPPPLGVHHPLDNTMVDVVSWALELERSTIARDILDHHPDAELFWAKPCTPPARVPTKPCRLFG